MNDENLEHVATPEERGDVVLPEAPSDPLPEPEAPQPEPEATEAKPEHAATIPRSRFEEVNEKLHQERQARLVAEARLRELQTPPVPPFDAQAAEREYLDAVTDGDREKARDLWTKIREHERRQTAEQLAAQVRSELTRSTEQMALATTAESLTEKYPFLDPNHATANPQAIQEVVEWRDYYIHAKGLTPAAALKKAANRIVPAYTAPDASAGADRTQAQRMTNAKVAATLPPSTTKAGLGERAIPAPKLDVSKMSEREFEALSEDERAKLRGDVVV